MTGSTLLPRSQSRIFLFAEPTPHPAKQAWCGIKRTNQRKMVLDNLSLFCSVPRQNWRGADFSRTSIFGPQQSLSLLLRTPSNCRGADFSYHAPVMKNNLLIAASNDNPQLSSLWLPWFSDNPRLILVTAIMSSYEPPPNFHFIINLQLSKLIPDPA